ncbi:MAG: hypothetical protein V1723_02600 [Candidatus Uhrbacteria bacterium]
MDVYINSRRIRLDPTMAIGKGGEADVYDIGGDRALKVFKSPDHPDYEGLAIEQEGARKRIATHQQKLRQFPKGLPSRVIVPGDLAMDRAGSKIVGYAMPLLRGVEVLRRYSEPAFARASAGKPHFPTHGDHMAALFRDLHSTVSGTHTANAVIGDFNDLNVLVRGSEAYLIDADSMQFVGFSCPVFTARFVDPTHCDSTATNLMLVRPHDAMSDWYAYAVMLFQSFCFVDPYGGVYVPKDPKRRMAHDARPLHRITVFHPEVRYPKPATPYGILPDDLLQYFHRTFEKDERTEFPLTMLETMRWTTCSTCGTAHARAVCPTCATAAPAAVRSVTVVRGKVTATRIFRTAGAIVYATTEHGELRWLSHERDLPSEASAKEGFRRENGALVLHGDLDPHVRYRLHGSETLLGKGGVLVTIAPGQAPAQRVVDQRGVLPVFDANASHTYWTEQGRLMRDGPLGPERIGDVLRGQTLFWVGERMGFGFYRAANLQAAFVFSAERHGIDDSVKLAPIPGHLIDATVAFAADRCWFLVSYEANGKTMHRATVIRSDGSVEATTESPVGDGSWLGTRIRGNAAAGNFLLAATDDGIVRVEPQNGTILETKRFPDTEPFVDAASRLFVTKDGVAAVGRQEITVLKMTTQSSSCPPPVDPP